MESPSGSRSRVSVWNEGLTCLYEPANGKAVVKYESCVADTVSRRLISSYSIIFVHGLGGHPKKTWTYEKRRARSGPSQQGSKSRLRIFGGTSPPDEEDEFEVENGVYWPLDLLPKATPTAKIWTWGYDSRISRFFSGAANQSIFETCCVFDVAHCPLYRQYFRPRERFAQRLGQRNRYFGKPHGTPRAVLCSKDYP